VDVVLQTERLVLRPFVADDLEPLHEILGDAETMRFYPAPFTLEDTAHWIERNQRRYADDGFGLWAVQERSTGAFVGDCGLTIQLVEGNPSSRSAGTFGAIDGVRGSPPRQASAAAIGRSSIWTWNRSSR